MHSSFYTVSNFLTFVRILLTPVLAATLFLQEWLIGLLLFSVLALTDFLDGFLARRLQQETALGAILDPVADKLCMLSCYGVLVAQAELPKGFVWFMVAKELCLLVGALVISLVYKQVEIKAALFGKIAMAMQVVFILFFVSTKLLAVPFYGKILLLVLIVITQIGALIDYFLFSYRRCLS